MNVMFVYREMELHCSFYSPLESTLLATNLPQGALKLSVSAVEIFIVVTTRHHHQRLPRSQMKMVLE